MGGTGDHLGLAEGHLVIARGQSQVERVVVLLSRLGLVLTLGQVLTVRLVLTLGLAVRVVLSVAVLRCCFVLVEERFYLFIGLAEFGMER